LIHLKPSPCCITKRYGDDASKELSTHSMNGTDKTFKRFKSVTGCDRLAARYSRRYPFTTVLLLENMGRVIASVRQSIPTYLLVCHLSQNHSCLHFTVRHFHLIPILHLGPGQNLILHTTP